MGARLRLGAFEYDNPFDRVQSVTRMHEDGTETPASPGKQQAMHSTTVEITTAAAGHAHYSFRAAAEITQRCAYQGR